MSLRREERRPGGEAPGPGTGGGRAAGAGVPGRGRGRGRTPGHPDRGRRPVRGSRLTVSIMEKPTHSGSQVGNSHLHARWPFQRALILFACGVFPNKKLDVCYYPSTKMCVCVFPKRLSPLKMCHPAGMCCPLPCTGQCYTSPPLTVNQQAVNE